MKDRLLPHPAPSVLLVIGTFAAVPYVHLQLESRRRFFPHVPCLVHDDHSPAAPRLRALCAEYGAEYVSPAERLRPNCGDLSAIQFGIQTTQDRRIDLAVKISRRFVPLWNWVSQLQDVAWHTQYATFSHRDAGHDLGFRTECLAFHAATWAQDEAMAQIAQAIEEENTPFRQVETLMHDLARAVQARAQCAANREYEALYPPPLESNAYGIWPWLGHNRKTRQPGYLWHQSDELLDYVRLSCAWGLRYGIEDFLDPNMGYGRMSPHDEKMCLPSRV